jgi:uncharacterized membrane protein YphA (DoxX/SURF4 family)
MSARRIISLILRVGLGAVFIMASVPKILDPAGFSRNVFHYQILPGNLVNAVAILLPWIELFVGLFLVFGIWLRGSAFIAIASLVVFLAAMGSALARGLNIDCGCFKTSGSPLGPERLIGDAVLLLAAILVYRWASPQALRSDQDAAEGRPLVAPASNRPT